MVSVYDSKMAFPDLAILKPLGLVLPDFHYHRSISGRLFGTVGPQES